MKRILLFLILGLVLSLGVSANHDDVTFEIQRDTLRINEEFSIIYNATVHLDEEVGLFIEYNDTKHVILNITTDTTLLNQKLEYTPNHTGVHYLGSFFTDTASNTTTYQYREELDVSHALPEPLNVVLGVLTLLCIIGAVLFNPVLYLLAIVFILTTLTSLLFTYSYILSPILIGVVSIIFVLLLVLVERIFRELF